LKRTICVLLVALMLISGSALASEKMPEISIAWVEHEQGMSQMLPYQGAVITMASMDKYYTYGLMDAEGNVLLPPRCSGEISYADRLTCRVSLWVDDILYQVGWKGKLISPREVKWEPPKLTPVYQNGKGGYADAVGHVVIPYQFDFAFAFCEGFASVMTDGHWGVINETGETVFTHDFAALHEFYEGRALALDQDGRYGFVDTTGTVVVPFIYEMALDFSEGLAAVCRDGKWGYLDTAGSLIVPCVYDDAGRFSGGLAILGDYDDEGIIKARGVLKNPLLVDSISNWADAEVEKARNEGFVTTSTDSYYTYDITRCSAAELVVNLVEKAMGRPLIPANADRFTDTDDELVLKAAAAGIISGTGNGSTFSPNALITREQLATMVYRAMGCVGQTSHLKGALTAYADGGAVSNWAASAVAALAGTGIMKGTSDTMLSPKDNATVEQAILLMLRAAG